MRPFDFYAPTTVVEALTLLDQYKDSVACIAGLFAIRRFLFRRGELKQEMVEKE